jgi:ribokinase
VQPSGGGGAVCVLGSANLDLVATTARLPAPGETVLGTDFAQHAGGKGLNQAVAAARAGAAASFLGAVGDDDAGTFLLAEMAAAGIDTSGVARTGRPTGRALITVDERGENSIVVVPGANDEVAVPALPPAAVLLAQLEVPAAAVADALRLARAAGVATLLNPAPAVRLEPALLDLVDVLVPNEHELAVLGSADALIAAGVAAVVATLGGAGVRVVTREQEWHVAPFHVLPVDTTGAGDAFCGTLAARLAAADPLDAAVRVAAAAGALATTTRGAVPSMPFAADVAALLASQ